MQVRDRFDLLPLRQLVRVDPQAGTAFPRQGLLDWLSRAERYQIISHGSGGQILAAGERALAEARVVLSQAYGPLVTFGQPLVHTYVDPQAETLMVPVIFMRIDVPRSQAQEVQRMLQERGADLREVEMQRGRAVLRAELELERSLGLERDIGEQTDGAAHILAWLVRYRPAAREHAQPAHDEAPLACGP